MNKNNIFIISLFSSVIINLDHGIIPASTIQIKKETNADSFFLGILGSLVFLGLMLGALVSGYAYSKLQCKIIILTSLTIICIFSILFPIFTHSYIIMLISRFIVGFFQIFLIVYYPVWIDIFGENDKTLWLSLLQISVLLGVIVGFIITGLFNFIGEYFPLISWKFSFYLQSLFILFFIYFYYKIDQKDLNTNGILLKDNNIRKSFINYKTLPLLDHNLFNESFMKNENVDVEDEVIYFQNLSIFQKCKTVIYKKIFIGCVLILSSLIYIVTAIQFWISDYIILNFGLSSYQTTILFAIISVTAPSLGLYSGGEFFTKLGGYGDLRTPKYILILLGCTYLFALILPIVNSFYLFLFILWLSLFVGASIISSTLGLMLISFEPFKKNLVMSMYQFFSNLLGYLPAPFFYGIISDKFGVRIALFLTVVYGMIMAIIGSIIIRIHSNTLIYKNKLFEDISKINKNIILMDNADISIIDNKYNITSKDNNLYKINKLIKKRESLKKKLLDIN